METSLPIKEQVFSLFIRQSGTLDSWLFRHAPIPKEVIEKHPNWIKWSDLCMNPNFEWNDDFVQQYLEKIDWNNLTKNPGFPWNADSIKRYEKHFKGKGNISINSGIDWNFDLLKQFKEKWNIPYLLTNSTIEWTPEMFLLLNLFEHSLHAIKGPVWDEEFILSNASKFNWRELSQNPHLPWTETLFEKVNRYWKNGSNINDYSAWDGFSMNQGFPWKMEFIEQNLPTKKNNHNSLSYKFLSKNNSLPWQQGLLTKYLNDWDVGYLSANDGVNFSEAQLEEYVDYLHWKGKNVPTSSLSMNPSLPWSDELINRYSDKWDWWVLGFNKGIEWNSERIHKFNDKLHFSALVKHPALPYSLEYLFEFESELFSAFFMVDFEQSEYIWQKCFQGVIDGGFVLDYLNQKEGLGILGQQLLNKKRVNTTRKKPPIDTLVKDIINYTLPLEMASPDSGVMETTLRLVSRQLLELLNDENRAGKTYVEIEKYKSNLAADEQGVCAVIFDDFSKIISKHLEELEMNLDEVNEFCDKFLRSIRLSAWMGRNRNHVQTNRDYVKVFINQYGVQLMDLVLIRAILNGK